LSVTNPYEAPQASLTVLAASQSTAEEMAPILDEFVFQNVSYYAKYYDDIRQGNKTPGFNWAAAIFSSLWFAYRKMYVWLFLYMAGTFAFGMLLFFVLEALETSGPINLVLALAWVIGIRYAIGKFANYLYLSMALRRIERIAAAAQSEQELREKVSLEGGTSGLACTLVIIGSALLNIIGNGV
jgi:hypothetical protein